MKSGAGLLTVNLTVQPVTEAAVLLQEKPYFLVIFDGATTGNEQQDGAPANHISNTPDSSMDDAEKRLENMMVLYNLLYRSTNHTSISLDAYLDLLISQISKNSEKSEAIRIETDIEDITLDADKLSVVGIILYELITNSIKHAFKDTFDGSITISGRLKNNRISITVKDNGIGFPGDIDPESTSSFGLRMVKMLTDQLKDSCTFSNDDGTRVFIDF